jgi:hypothetical protein
MVTDIRKEITDITEYCHGNMVRGGVVRTYDSREGICHDNCVKFAPVVTDNLSFTDRVELLIVVHVSTID